MSKKYIAIISLTAIITLLAGLSYANESISVQVNGKSISMDTPAQIINGRTMVPVRFVSEALGAKVSWDEKTSTVIIATDKDKYPPQLKLNGEQTTWPYWYEDDILYMEYRNAMQLIKEYHPHPTYVPIFFRDSNIFSLDGKQVEVPAKIKGDFKVISINYLQREHIVNYEWDPATGNLKFIPIK